MCFPTRTHIPRARDNNYVFGETLITGFSVYYESQGYVFPSDNYVSLTIVRAVTPSACAAGVKVISLYVRRRCCCRHDNRQFSRDLRVCP